MIAYTRPSMYIVSYITYFLQLCFCNYALWHLSDGKITWGCIFQNESLLWSDIQLYLSQVLLLEEVETLIKQKAVWPDHNQNILLFLSISFVVWRSGQETQQGVGGPVHSAERQNI